MRFVEIINCTAHEHKQQGESCQCAARQAKRKPHVAKPFNTPKPIKRISSIQPVKPIKLTEPKPRLQPKNTSKT